MLSDRIWPSRAAQKALGAILTPPKPIEVHRRPNAASAAPEPTEGLGPVFPYDLVKELASICWHTADYDYEYEYGYGGELHEYRSVSNWEEVVVAILTAMQGASGEGDSSPQRNP